MQQPTGQIPANDNSDVYLRADTALNELYPLWRALLAQDTRGYTFEQWQRRRQVVNKMSKAISLCLRKL